MTYRKPLLLPVAHAADLALCSPAPYSPSECDSAGGIYLGHPGGVDTCMIPPDDPANNVEQSALWLCMMTGGCAPS